MERLSLWKFAVLGGSLALIGSSTVYSHAGDNCGCEVHCGAEMQSCGCEISCGCEMQPSRFTEPSCGVCEDPSCDTPGWLSHKSGCQSCGSKRAHITNLGQGLLDKLDKMTDRFEATILPRQSKNFCQSCGCGSGHTHSHSHSSAETWQPASPSPEYQPTPHDMTPMYEEPGFESIAPQYQPLDQAPQPAIPTPSKEPFAMPPRANEAAPLSVPNLNQPKKAPATNPFLDEARSSRKSIHEKQTSIAKSDSSRKQPKVADVKAAPLTIDSGISSRKSHLASTANNKIAPVMNEPAKPLSIVNKPDVVPAAAFEAQLKFAPAKIAR